MISENQDNLIGEVSKLMNRDVGFLDACTQYCSKHEIEVELIGELIKRNPSLLALAQQEAESLHLVPKAYSLPFNE